MRDRRRRKLADELKSLVERGTTYAQDPLPPPIAQEVISWGRGIQEVYDPALGPYVNDSVYALTKRALYFRHETHAIGMERFDLTANYEAAEAREAVDGRWDLLLVPRGISDQQEFKGFGFVESYGGLPLMVAADYAVSAALDRLFEVPTEVDDRLSTESLDDVPATFGAKSHDDASDWTVLRAAERGLSHNYINIGVAYRVLFAHRLGDGEIAESIHRLFIAEGTMGHSPEEPAPGLLMITDRGLLWHFASDGIPDVGGIREPGIRGLQYEEIKAASGKRSEGAGKEYPAKEVLALKAGIGGSRLYIFYFEATPEDRARVDTVLERVPDSMRG